MGKFTRSAAGRRIAGFGSMALALVAIAPANMFATPIPLGGGGTLIKSNQTGSLLGVTTVPLQCIAFSGSPTCSGTTTTTFLVSGQDPIFATGPTGTIKDIGTTFPITSFETVSLTVPGGPAIFDLENIIPAGGSPCAPGQTSGTCSTGTFLLQTGSAPNSVAILLSLNEIGYLGSSSTGSTPYGGIFQTTLIGNLSFYTNGACTTDVNIGDILSCEESGHTITSSWSGTQSPISGVPEPMTSSLMGLGLLGLGLISRRRKQS